MFAKRLVQGFFVVTARQIPANNETSDVLIRIKKNNHKIKGYSYKYLICKTSMCTDMFVLLTNVDSTMKHKRD